MTILPICLLTLVCRFSGLPTHPPWRPAHAIRCRLSRCLRTHWPGTSSDVLVGGWRCVTVARWTRSPPGFPAPSVSKMDQGWVAGGSGQEP